MNRTIEYLTQTREFQSFLRDNNLTFRMLDKNYIFVITNYYTIQFYSLINEDQFYVDFFTNDFQFYASASTLLSTIQDRRLIKDIYQEERSKRTDTLLPDNNNNRVRLLSSEQEFFIYLRLIGDFLTDYLRGTPTPSHLTLFSKTSQAQRDFLKRALEQEQTNTDYPRAN